MAEWWGVGVAADRVCLNHSAPLDFLTAWTYDRPPVSLVLGPRGGGKSYLAALATHVDSIVYPGQGTRILGGSLSQSRQIYGALKEFDRVRPGAFRSITKTEASYLTGSDVSILAASPTSVRGPHVPTLRLDEVDEIDDDIREAATGMCMAKGGLSASVSMTSTWHNVGGPMGKLREQADAGRFPWYSFCAFEILERCPESQSGPYVGGEDLYRDCPQCPLKPWCHAERDRNGGRALAKLSGGHYSVDGLVQKTALVSPRVFESDYLCKGPRAEGLWFKDFDAAPGGKHVNASAEFDPARPVVASVDSGVFTGAVFFQTRTGPGGVIRVNVFGDYLTENAGAEANALAIVAHARSLGVNHFGKVLTDPAGSSRNAVGPTVEAEYLRSGLKDVNGRIDRWPNYPGSVRASLDLVEALLLSADGTVSLTVHPRCRALVAGLQNFRRAKRGGHWQDYPAPDDHPHEDIVDPLRSGLLSLFPDGRRPAPAFRSTPGHRIGR